jgi:AcrR family transcriptional regulator
MDATRGRILESAIELFIERGISATTMREIGERADVAPGTLRNHFASREELEAAIVAHLVEEAPLPESTVFEGATTIDERLARLFRIAGTFFDQAARLYRMWLREPMVSGPWLAAGARFGERWDLLMRLALGELAADATAMTVLRAVLHPRFYEDLAPGAASATEVADLVASLVTPWFVDRGRSGTRRG